MTPQLYLLIGVIYADIVLIKNMLNTPYYGAEQFIVKLGCYIGDIVVWPFSLIGSTALYFITGKGE